MIRPRSDLLVQEPLHLTDREEVADFLLSLENRERYLQQSAATRVNAPAPLPPRPALAGIHH